MASFITFNRTTSTIAGQFIGNAFFGKAFSENFFGKHEVRRQSGHLERLGNDLELISPNFI
jgi:hypothetical protein